MVIAVKYVLHYNLQKMDAINGLNFMYGKIIITER